MRDLIVFCFIGCVVLGAALGYRTLNPPPPPDYEIVYFGSVTCGACVRWKRTDLVEWRKDPASRSAPIHLADLPRGRDPRNGGYGRHQDVFDEAFGDSRRITWPSFVLLNHGEVERVVKGTRGFHRITDQVRRAHHLENPS